MPELGDPTSYLQVPEGVPVYSADGQEVGKLEHVLADPNVDIFDGLIVDTRTGPGGWRFADATLVASLHERGVVLTLDAAAAARLPEPRENPATLAADPDDAAPEGLGNKLRRAWDLISGRY